MFVAHREKHQREEGTKVEGVEEVRLLPPRVLQFEVQPQRSSLNHSLVIAKRK